MQKYRDRNGKSIAILFKSIGVRVRFEFPDIRPFFRNNLARQKLTSYNNNNNNNLKRLKTYFDACLQGSLEGKKNSENNFRGKT